LPGIHPSVAARGHGVILRALGRQITAADGVVTARVTARVLAGAVIGMCAVVSQ
jgi:hypothetical protein